MSETLGDALLWRNFTVRDVGYTASAEYWRHRAIGAERFFAAAILAAGGEIVLDKRALQETDYSAMEFLSYDDPAGMKMTITCRRKT